MINDDHSDDPSRQYVTRDSGKMAEYADGMRRDTSDGKPKFRLMWPEGIPFEEQLMYRVAMHYAQGGEKYGDRNWEKSSTPESLAHHAEATERHLHKFLLGVEDGEDHAAAVVWGINAILLTRRNIAGKLAAEVPEEMRRAPVQRLAVPDPDKYPFRTADALTDIIQGLAVPDPGKYLFRTADALTDSEDDSWIFDGKGWSWAHGSTELYKGRSLEWLVKELGPLKYGTYVIRSTDDGGMEWG